MKSFKDFMVEGLGTREYNSGRIKSKNPLYKTNIKANQLKDQLPARTWNAITKHKWFKQFSWEGTVPGAGEPVFRHHIDNIGYHYIEAVHAGNLTSTAPEHDRKTKYVWRVSNNGSMLGAGYQIKDEEMSKRFGRVTWNWKMHEGNPIPALENGI